MTATEAARMAELEDRVAFLSDVVAAAYRDMGMPVPPELIPPQAPKHRPRSPRRSAARLTLIGGAS